MKRIAFALLAFAASAWAFADDATAPATPAPPAPQGQFHSWNIGEFLPVESLNNGPVSTGWGPNWDNAGGLDQEWGFTYDAPDKAYGFDATTEFGGADAFNNVTTGNASGNDWSPALSWFGTYFNIGDAKAPIAKIYAGMPRDNDYTFLTYINGNPTDQRLMDSQWGANLQIFPVSGLALMLTDFVPGSSNSNSPYNIDFQDNFAVGAKYTVPNTATVYGYYKAIQGGEGGITATGYNVTNYDNPSLAPNASGATAVNKKYVDFGVQYNAIKNVGLQAEYAYDFSTQGTGSGTTAALVGTGTVGESRLYLGATTTAVENWVFTGDLFFTNDAAFTSISLEGQIQYNIPSTGYSVGLTFGYDQGGDPLFNGGGDAAPTLAASGPGLPGADGVLIYPYVQQSFDGGNADIRIGFEYESGGVTNTNTGNNASVGGWAVPISYVWTF